MRLIDADALNEALNKREAFYHNSNAYETASMFHMIRAIYVDDSPTIDAVPVIHGHWVKDRLVSTSGGTYGVRRCSVCEWYCTDTPYQFDYCPHCGAKMDGDIDD